MDLLGLKWDRSASKKEKKSSRPSFFDAQFAKKGLGRDIRILDPTHSHSMSIPWTLVNPSALRT